MSRLASVLLTQVGFRPARFHVHVLLVPLQVLHVPMSACSATSNVVRRGFLLLRNYALYFLLSIFYGKIELNPGPQVQLKVLLNRQEPIMAKLYQIEGNLASADSQLNDLCSRLESVESKIDRLYYIKTVLQEYK